MNAVLCKFAVWRVENGELDGFTARASVLEVGHCNLKVRGDSVANTVAGVSAVLRGVFAAANGVITCTPEPTGTMIIIR